jgi:hypothetical protein
MSAPKERTVYTVWTNQDLTEGRGYEYPLAVCETESTARRLGKGRYVQGSDCRVTETTLFLVDHKWYGPVAVTPPTKEDIAAEVKLQAAKAAAAAKLAAIDKARALGLSDEDIAALKAI